MILKSFLELLRAIAFFEDIAESNLSIFDFDIQEGKYVTKISSNNYWKIWGKNCCDIIYTEEADSLFKCSRCRVCDDFIYKPSHFSKYLLKCKYRMSHIWPKNMYQLQEVLFETVEGFIISKFEIKTVVWLN